MSKYKAVPTTVDGIRFDSKAEANRYGMLKLLQRDGAISDLKLQPRIPFTIRGEQVFEYRADFSYRADGVVVIEDVKGMDTPVSKLKRKIVQADQGITIDLVDGNGNRISPKASRSRRRAA